MRSTIRVKTIYFFAILLTLSTIYLGFSQSIKSRIFHHIYQVGPYVIEPWLPLGIHVVLALSIISVLTVVILINIFRHNNSQFILFQKFLTTLLYYCLFPSFLLVTPVVIYHYNSTSPFDMVSLSYFWMLVAYFYYLCFKNWHKQIPIHQYDDILELYLVLSSAAALRIIVYVAFEILKLNVSVEATFLYTSIYMNCLLLFFLSLLGHLGKKINVIYLTVISTIVLTILFFILPVTF